MMRLEGWPLYRHQAFRGEQSMGPYRKAKPRKAIVQPMPAAISRMSMCAASIEAQTRVSAAAMTAA